MSNEPVFKSCLTFKKKVIVNSLFFSIFISVFVQVFFFFQFLSSFFVLDFLDMLNPSFFFFFFFWFPSFLRCVSLTLLYFRDLFLFHFRFSFLPSLLFFFLFLHRPLSLIDQCLTSGSNPKNTAGHCAPNHNICCLTVVNEIQKGRDDVTVTHSLQKYTSLIFISRKDWNWPHVWERDRSERRKHRLGEDFDIDLFLTNVVIPYSGPYVLASLTGGPQPGSVGAAYLRPVACRTPSEPLDCPTNWLTVTDRDSCAYVIS